MHISERNSVQYHYPTYSEQYQTYFILLRLISATEQVNGELHKTQVFLITSTLLVVKNQNIYRNTRKMHITMKTDLCL